MAVIKMRVRDLKRVFMEAAGFEPVDQWAGEMTDGDYPPWMDDGAAEAMGGQPCENCGSTNTETDSIPSMMGHGTDDSITCNDCGAVTSFDPFTGKPHVRMPKRLGEGNDGPPKSRMGEARSSKHPQEVDARTFEEWCQAVEDAAYTDGGIASDSKARMRKAWLAGQQPYEFAAGENLGEADTCDENDDCGMHEADADDIECVECGEIGPKSRKRAKQDGWLPADKHGGWICPRCYGTYAGDDLDEADVDVDEGLVSRAEVEQWIEQQPMQDITGKPNLRAFDRRLEAMTGDRELSDEALEVLYDRYPKLMRAFEHGIHEADLDEDAPKGKGWERVTKGLKKAKSVDNPWAVAHSMKSKGARPREQK